MEQITVNKDNTKDNDFGHKATGMTLQKISITNPRDEDLEKLNPLPTIVGALVDFKQMKVI